MVGYVPTNLKVKAEQEEKLNQDSTELRKSNDPIDFTILEEDFPESFLDSILDFSGWVEETPDPSMADVTKHNLEISEKSVEIEKEDLGCLIEEEMGKVSLGAEVMGVKSDEIASNTGRGSTEIEENEVEVELKKGINGAETSEVKDAGGNGVNNDVKKAGENGDAVSGTISEKEPEEVEKSSSEEESDSESEEEESSESSSSSSSDEDEDEDEDDEEEEGEDRKKVKGEEGEVEMEEGEIRDFEVEEMVAWSDDEDGNVVKGPIRSKNEVQDLPPVPPVNVTLESHHQILPVGVVLSILGAQVIVEGVEKHNPLSEGSILWITESRSPLGIVDEIFGPVKNPYYIVRYNSESEVPTGIQQGSLISFVPEFADYVLNNNNLFKKGYDASGENDEELSDELEFSDDEKEAEYKRMLQKSKRGSNEQKNGNTKKDKKSKNRGGNWRNDQQPSPTMQSNSTIHGSSGGPTSVPVMSPALSPRPQSHNLAGPSSGVWTNGIPPIQQQNMGFLPNGFPPNVPFMQQNFPQQPFQNLPLPNTAPFHPQLNTGGPIFPSNFVLQGGPPNFCAGPAFPSWPANMSQNGFSQTQVGPPVAIQGLISTSSMNMLPQGVLMPNAFHMENNGGMRPPMFNTLHIENASSMRPPLPGGHQMENNTAMSSPMPNGLQMENNNGSRPSFVAGSGEATQNPNHGNGYRNRGGRKPFQRGGGRFRGGRGGRGGQQHSR